MSMPKVYISTTDGCESVMEDSIRKILEQNGSTCVGLHLSPTARHTLSAEYTKKDIRGEVERCDTFVISVGEDCPRCRTLYMFETELILLKARGSGGRTCCVVVERATSLSTNPIAQRMGGIPRLAFEDSDLFKSSLLRSLGKLSIVPRYPHKLTGLALIMCNGMFHGGGLRSDRASAKKDEGLYKKAAEEMGLETIVCGDLTAEGMRTTIEMVKSKIDIKDTVLAVFISTHGFLGYVYGTDGQSLNIMQDVMTPFCRKSCPELDGKPKCFFIQACQELKVDTFTSYPDKPKTPLSPGCTRDVCKQTDPDDKPPGTFFSDAECSTPQDIAADGSPTLLEMPPPSSPTVQESAAHLTGPLTTGTVPDDEITGASNEAVCSEAASHATRPRGLMNSPNGITEEKAVYHTQPSCSPEDSRVTRTTQSPTSICEESAGLSDHTCAELGINTHPSKDAKGVLKHVKIRAAEGESKTALSCSGPPEADMVVSFSGLSYSPSYQRRRGGSFYAEALWDAVCKYIASHDLEEILKIVSAKVRCDVEDMRQLVLDNQVPSEIPQDQQPYYISTCNYKVHV